jgi:tryptophan 2,3-dioxygenase
MTPPNSKKITVEDTLDLLKERFNSDGQDLNTHLNGLLHSKYVNYWDYIRLDTLLTLQKPRTDFPDEMIFIVYHQITELYFKLILHELKLIEDQDVVTSTFFKTRIQRINWCFGQMINSFDIISVGLEQEQFLKFRAALTPASGFQSVQYRMIELASTDLINLIHTDDRKFLGDDDYITTEEMFEKVYWKKGAIDATTGQKTLTLRAFEKEYNAMLLKVADEHRTKNLWSVYRRLTYDEQTEQSLVDEMRKYDMYANLYWPLTHFKHAIHHLIAQSDVAEATGGTNWRQYLPPKFQKRIFFDALWSAEEQENWGKAWVESEVLTKIKKK